MKYGYTCPACGSYVHRRHAAGKKCPKCKAAPFPGAGEAPHKCVLFFGEKNSGKLSAILALVQWLEKPGNGLSAEIVQSDYEHFQDRINDYPGGPLPQKPGDRRFSSVTLELTDNQWNTTQYLTLTCVSPTWENGEKEDFFPKASARVVCWNMRKDWDRRQFSEEKKMLMWNLGGSDKYGITLQAQLEDFIKQICPEEYRRDQDTVSEQDVRNLLARVRRIQPRNTAPVLLLYNKHDTIDAEKWRIPGNPGSASPVRYLLDQEQYACSHETVSRELCTLSPKLIGMLRETLGNCFYAQLRCAPYGTTVYQEPTMLKEAEDYLKITKALLDIVRLHKYEMEFQRPDADQSHKDQQILNDSKKNPNDICAKYTWEVAERVEKRIQDNNSFPYTPERMDMVDITMERAERHHKWAENRVKQIQNPNGREPKNVDQLGKWLLYVTGCKPMRLSVAAANGRWTGTYRITEPEYRGVPLKKQCRRNQKAQKTNHSRKWEQLRMEAAARCYLFENPDPQSRNCVCASTHAQMRRLLFQAQNGEKPLNENRGG